MAGSNDVSNTVGPQDPERTNNITREAFVAHSMVSGKSPSPSGSVADHGAGLDSSEIRDTASREASDNSEHLRHVESAAGAPDESTTADHTTQKGEKHNPTTFMKREFPKRVRRPRRTASIDLGDFSRRLIADEENWGDAE